MLEDIKNQVQSSISPLVGGILDDTQELIRQELALAKSEVKHEAAKLKTALISVGVAASVFLLALITLSITGAHLLAWLFPELPLWAAFGIVAAAELLLASLLFFKSKQDLESINLIPPQTAATLKEIIHG